MKIQAKIASVQDDLESWQDFYIVVGHFEDGSKFKAWSKDQAKATATRNELAAMAGVAGEFEIDETKTKEYRGVKELRLKGWPGKPERQPWSGGGGGGGGRAPYQPRYRDTPEGTRAEQDSIHRSVALTQAVLFLKDQPNPMQIGDPTIILHAADRFSAWLSQGQPPLPSTAPAASSGPPVQSQSTIGSFDPLKEQKEFFGADTQSLPTRSKAVDKYLEEISHAVQKKDSERIGKLAQMATQSLEKRSITQADLDQWIEPAIVNARQALQGSAEVDAW